MAYAALVSLMHILEDAQLPAGYPTLVFTNLNASLSKKIEFLQGFLEEDYCHRRIKELEALEGRIRQAVNAAEDVIESHIVDFILAKSTIERGELLTIFCVDLQLAIQEIDCLMKEVMEIKDHREMEDEGRTKYSRANFSSGSFHTGDGPMVGFDEDLIQIMDEITGNGTFEIFPITGMGGIGKTTLAKSIFESPLAAHHFDVRAWLSISQEYNLKEILLTLLRSVKVYIYQRTQDTHENLVAYIEELGQMSDYQLGEQLYKSLSGWRYLIVLDDMWSIEAWLELRRFFPNNRNRSRVIVTTRLLKLAEQFGSREPHRVKPLKTDESWELLSIHAFREDECPPELEEVAMRILKKCKGLPLAIVVLGGLLSKLNMTRESWERIEEDISAMINSDNDDYCLNILYLSYSHLPIHLKPCFLYLGVFPEDRYISFSKLIKMWVSEGFLKPVETKTLEEVAEEYLNDLIDRNLILSCRVGSFCKELKGCWMHDLLRDLCMREAHKDSFFSVTNIYNTANYPGMKSSQRIIVHQHMGYQRGGVGFPQSTPPMRARSLVCSTEGLPSKFTTKCRLLKVFDTVGTVSVNDILQLVNSRYLSFKIDVNLSSIFPSSISKLCNLQTLIVESVLSSANSPVFLPSEIWDMPQLRHLKFSSVCLPDPADTQTRHREGVCVLENLETLCHVMNLRTTEEVVRRIPNVKKLRLFCEDASIYGAKWSYYCLNNLVHLRKLETLMLSCVGNGRIYPGELEFPDTLRKLTLLNCRFPWDDMSIIGSLPNLEVLILEKDAFHGKIWKPREGEFLQLKFLSVSAANLKHWHADRDHFPKLETLALLGCWKLKKIPSDIGEIPTLNLISLCLCSSSAVKSAKKILRRQRSFGNNDLQVCVNKRIMFSKKLEHIQPLFPDFPSEQIKPFLDVPEIVEPPKPWDVELGSNELIPSLLNFFTFEVA